MLLSLNYNITCLIVFSIYILFVMLRYMSTGNLERSGGNGLVATAFAAMCFGCLLAWYKLPIMGRILLCLFVAGICGYLISSLYLFWKMNPKNAIQEMKRDLERMTLKEQRGASIHE